MLCVALHPDTADAVLDDHEDRGGASVTVALICYLWPTPQGQCDALVGYYGRHRKASVTVALNVCYGLHPKASVSL